VNIIDIIIREADAIGASFAGAALVEDTATSAAEILVRIVSAVTAGGADLKIAATAQRRALKDNAVARPADKTALTID